MTQPLRFPAEWEPQSAVLLAWPHEGTDWAARLAQVEQTYVALVAAITRFEPALVCVAGAELRERASAQLASAGVDLSRVRFFEVDYDDTWLRDSGPISLREGAGFRLLDFHFTAWGGKFEAGRDDQIVGKLHAAGLFAGASHRRVDFALEGGGIETDGRGTLLSTWRCLHERHPDKSREAVTELLERELVQRRTLWLDHGYLEGDDTDAHIDTLARFAAQNAGGQDQDQPENRGFGVFHGASTETGPTRVVFPVSTGGGWKGSRAPAVNFRGFRRDILQRES